MQASEGGFRLSEREIHHLEMGYDARVAVGQHRNQGHAWVVVFGKSEVYLLEATSKRKLKSWKHYPLARE